VLAETWHYVLAASPPWGWYQDLGETTTFTATLTGLATPYVSSQTGALNTPPVGPWTPDSTGNNCDGGDSETATACYHLNIVHAFDVSALTKNGAVTLTLQLQIAVPASAPYGYVEFNPLAVELQLFGGVNLTLTQASGSFRPRDSRDNAAYCAAADPAGQMHDGDCHPQFTAKLTGLESYATTACP
jgi:hypothetical protein